MSNKTEPAWRPFQIPPTHLIGRDALMDRTWQSLESRSLLVSADRRLGKTHILKAMHGKGRPGFQTFFRDLAGVNSPNLFLQYLINDVEKALKRSRLEKARKLLGEFPDVKLGEVAIIPRRKDIPWQAAMEKTVAEIIEKLPKKMLVYFWDEVPWMLQNIAENPDYGPSDAAALLSALRAMRNSFPALRQVLTGSVGFHHTVADIRKILLANEPVNDMATIEVPPLAEQDATFLAQCLLRGNGNSGPGFAETANLIGRLTEGRPWYIHSLIGRMPRETGADPDLARATFEELLVDPSDDLRLEHYDTRLPSYYGKYGRSMPRIARKILTTVAQADDPVHIATILAELTVGMPDEDALDEREEQGRTLIHLLAKDHYLAQVPGSSTIRFRSNLLKQWWRQHRGLM